MTELTDLVADIVVERPLTARVFERHAIDYCCRGRRSLAAACTEAGLDPVAVAAELDAVADDGSGAGAAALPGDVGGLIGHVVAVHHTYLRRALPRARELGATVVAAHGDRHPELADVERLVDELADDLFPHLLKEERVLFPLAIQLLGAVGPEQLHCGSVANPIGVMHVEHERAGELLAELRHRTDGYRPTDDACPTWHAWYAALDELERDVHTHVHIENNVLFPAIARLELVTSR